MRNNKLLVFALSLVAVAAVGVGSTLAYFTDNEAATNVLTMGNVNISLIEDKWEGDKAGVVPGASYEKNPTVIVENGSADCYVRVSLVYDGLSEEQIAQFTDENTTDGNLDIKEGWVKSGDYYYYQGVMKAGESQTMFENILIPYSWGNEMVGKQISLTVKAEAIQKDNFTPETADGVIVGWGAVTIQDYDQYAPQVTDAPVVTSEPQI